ncbi:MAG: ABC transporter permease, partial [Rhodocyclaceae bacterium]|nr:ABC transporter permease [Rhodocyclaceae bacterium]
MQETSQASPPTSPHVQTPFDRFWREFAESRLALLGLAVLIIVMVIAIAAPLLAPQNPYDLAQLDVLDGKLAPGEQSMGGKTYLLGTDDQGRDMLSGI